MRLYKSCVDMTRLMLTAGKEAAAVVDRSPKPAKVSNSNGELSQEEIMLNRQKFMAKMMKGNKPESGWAHRETL